MFKRKTILKQNDHIHTYTTEWNKKEKFPASQSNTVLNVSNVMFYEFIVHKLSRYHHRFYVKQENNSTSYFILDAKANMCFKPWLPNAQTHTHTHVFVVDLKNGDAHCSNLSTYFSWNVALNMDSPCYTIDFNENTYKQKPIIQWSLCSNLLGFFLSTTHRLCVCVPIVWPQWQYQHVNKFQLSIFYGLARKSAYTTKPNIHQGYNVWNCVLLAGGQFKWMTHYNSLEMK